MLMTQQACSTTTMNKSQPYSDSASTAAETMTSEQATEYARFSRESNALNTWTDTFFDDDDDIVAVFDFDYDSMISYYTKLTWLIFTLITISGPVFASIIFIRRYWPLWILYYLVLYFLRANVIWNVRAQHLAITRDGIRFVRNRRPFLCGLPCSDLGKTSKTVPFDKITDCDVTEPAGCTCICIRNVLYTVSIDTASSGQHGMKELKLSGLCDPYAFKKLVWTMKRTQRFGGAELPNVQIMGRGEMGNNNTVSMTEMIMLLREVRDELRNNHQNRKGNVNHNLEATVDTALSSIALAEFAAATEDAIIV